jgi:hypothetical protein
MVTQKQVQLLQRAAPMKTYGNHNYSKPNQLLPYFAIILLLEKPIPISNYTSIKYTFEWRSADGTLLSTANDFSTGWKLYINRN